MKTVIRRTTMALALAGPAALGALAAVSVSVSVRSKFLAP
jgi:hypothetical protein